MTYLVGLFKQFCDQMVQVLSNCRSSDNITFLATLLQNFVLAEIEKRDTRYLREQVEMLERQVAAKLEGIKDERVTENVKDQIYRPIEMHLQKEKELSVEQEMRQEIEVDREQLRLSGSGLVEYLEKNVKSGESPGKPQIKASMDSIDQLGDFSRRNLEFNLNSMRHQAEVSKNPETREEPVIEEVQMDKESCVTGSGRVSPKRESAQTKQMPLKLNKKRNTFKKKKKKSEKHVKVEEIDEILVEQEQLKEDGKEKRTKKKERKKNGRSKSVKSVAKKKKKAKPKPEIKSVSPFQTGQLEDVDAEEESVKIKSKSTRKRKKTRPKAKSETNQKWPRALASWRRWSRSGPKRTKRASGARPKRTTWTSSGRPCIIRKNGTTRPSGRKTFTL